MDAQSGTRLMTAKIVGSYLRHHTVGTGELPDLIGSVHRALSTVGQLDPKEELLTLLSRFANPYATTMWFFSIAAIGEKPSAATSAPDTA